MMTTESVRAIRQLAQCRNHPPNQHCQWCRASDITSITTALNKLAEWIDTQPITKTVQQMPVWLKLRVREPIMLKLRIKRPAQSQVQRKKTKRRKRCVEREHSGNTHTQEKQMGNLIQRLTNHAAIKSVNSDDEQIQNSTKKRRNLIVIPESTPPSQVADTEKDVQLFIPETAPSPMDNENETMEVAGTEPMIMIPETEEVAGTEPVLQDSYHNSTMEVAATEFANSPASFPSNIQLEVPEMPEVSDTVEIPQIDDIPDMPELSQDGHQLTDDEHDYQLNTRHVVDDVEKEAYELKTTALHLASDSDATPNKNREALEWNDKNSISKVCTPVQKTMNVVGNNLKTSPNSTAASTVPPEAEELAITPFGRRVQGRSPSPPSEGSLPNERERNDGSEVCEIVRNEEPKEVQKNDHLKNVSSIQSDLHLYRNNYQQQRQQQGRERLPNNDTDPAALKDITNIERKEETDSKNTQFVTCRLRIRDGNNQDKNNKAISRLLPPGSQIGEECTDNRSIPVSLGWSDTKDIPPFVVCITGLDCNKLEFELAFEIITQLGAEPVVDSIDIKADVVVTSIEKNGWIKDSSKDIMEMAVRKIPVVSMGWLVASFSCGYWVPLESFLVASYGQKRKQ